jgi:hypothetical protein
MYQPSIKFPSLFLWWDYILNIAFFFLYILKDTHLFFCRLKFCFEESFTIVYTLQEFETEM